MSAASPSPVTADQIRAWDDRDAANRDADGVIRRRAVADLDGQVVAYSLVYREPFDPPGSFYLWVTVADGRRGQGVGGFVYEEALAFARSHGAPALRSEVQEAAPDALAWAPRRGFTIERHTYESTLDLASFDATPFAGLLDRVAGAGIRLFSLAEGGNTPELAPPALRGQLPGVLDDPGYTGRAWLSYAQFSHFFTERWFQPEGQFLAADGDAVIGLSAITCNAETGEATQMITAWTRLTGAGHRPGAQAARRVIRRSRGARLIRTNKRLDQRADAGDQPQAGLSPGAGPLPPDLRAAGGRGGLAARRPRPSVLRLSWPCLRRYSASNRARARCG